VAKNRAANSRAAKIVRHAVAAVGVRAKAAGGMIGPARIGRVKNGPARNGLGRSAAGDRVKSRKLGMWKKQGRKLPLLPHRSNRNRPSRYLRPVSA